MNKPRRNIIPEEPGVYIFRGENNKVIYVGKAVNLKNRLKNYFTKNTDERRLKLVAEARRVNYYLTSSELEALLLEARLIKQYQPFYNISLKDDKRYIYVGITKDRYPTVRLIRQPEKELMAQWYGPFPTSNSIKSVLDIIRKIYPFRTCRVMPKKPCLYYHIGLCPGVCIQSIVNYKRSISKINLILNGKIRYLQNLLKKQMKITSDNMDYGKAQEYKNKLVMIDNMLRGYHRVTDEDTSSKKILAIRKLLVRWSGQDPLSIYRLEAYDVSNFGNKIKVGSMVVFTNGEPDKNQYRQFNLQHIRDDPAGISEIIGRRLKHNEWILPQVILVDGGITQISAAFKSLVVNNMSGKICLLGLTKEKETVIIPRIENCRIISWKSLRIRSLSPASPALLLLMEARDEAHRFARRYYLKLSKNILTN